MNTKTQGKNWCFTVNNYDDMDQIMFKELSCTYMVYGREIGESGTPHLQGFVVMSSNKRLNAMKQICPKAHWELAKGAADQNRVYCTKDGDYIETGTIPINAKRKGEMEIERWELALTAAKSGDLDSVPADILIRNYGNLLKIKAAHQVAPTALSGELINTWMWGPPGSGKTSRAFSENPLSFLKGLNKWWDGYVDQKTVIVDDMDPFHKSLAQEFKVWAHHYPFPAEIKGGSMCIRPEKIVVTSNYRIDEIWDDEITREAMHRRFVEIYVPSNKSMKDNELIL